MVSFVTKESARLPEAHRQGLVFAFKAAYDSADTSLSETTTVAGRKGEWSAVVSYTRRDGEEAQAKTDAHLNDQTIQRNGRLR